MILDKDKKQEDYEGIKLDNAEKYSDISTIQSVLAGVGSGLIAIPKGLFSLGAALIDAGAGTDNAARVEKYFNDLTELDEMAEATTAGRVTELLVNLGVPGVGAYSKGASLASKAMQSKKLGQYFVANNSRFLSGMDKAAELNRLGKTGKFVAAATSSGVADGIFIGDVEKAGTFGDLIGGPTEIDRGDGEYDAERYLLNRIKFGTEGALFTGVIAGAGKTIKKLANRNNKDRYHNDAMVRAADKLLGKIASKGDTPQLFASIEKEVGRRSADDNLFQESITEMSKHIDGIFPLWRPMANKLTPTQRVETLDLLLHSFKSGSKPELKYFMDRAPGVAIKDIRKPYASFGPMDDVVNFKGKNVNVRDRLKELKMSQKDIDGIFGNMSLARMRMGDMVSDQLQAMPKKEASDFLKIGGEKLKNYITNTYDIFAHKGGVLHNKYPPARAAMDKAKELFKQQNKDAIDRVNKRNLGVTEYKKTFLGAKSEIVPEELTDEAAEMYVNQFLKQGVEPGEFSYIKPSKAPNILKSSEPIIKLPEGLTKYGFSIDTMANDLNRVGKAGFTSLDNVTKAERKVFEELFGKQNDVISTIVASSSRLSMYTRKNQFFADTLKDSDTLAKIGDKEMIDAAAAGTPLKFPETKQIFYENMEEAVKKTGLDPSEFLEIGKAKRGITIDPNIRYEPSLVNALDGKFALREVAEAFEAADAVVGATTTRGKIYQNFILYPKATSQIAKTILSPITHVRNFVSAGAFAAANGIVPNADAMKNAYQALQIPLKGARQQNDFYRELLELGVVNSNVRLGDIQRLLSDVKFGETVKNNVDSGKFLGKFIQRMGKFKKGAEDFYTAEDDFWKIVSWSGEKSRLARSFEAAGLKEGDAVMRFDGRMVKYNEKFLKEEAADIVKNNIPNYARVSEFVKGLRKLPIGNFVSFPAEIMRTSTNIVNRAMREIKYSHTLTDGTVVNPLKNIGYKRLIGFGTTVAAVPYATVEAAKMLYDVSEDEMQALRRYVADWSKNSTLIPIKDKKTGKFKYIDFSHANAYDTLTRPIQNITNAIAAGKQDENGMMDDFMKGVFSATKELGSPFISESIWTEALTDIVVRKGRTAEGFQVWNPQDNYGEKVSKSVSHLVKSQAPFSYPTLKRLDVAFKPIDLIQDKPGEFDKYGESYELGDELLGFVGLRAVPVNPERTLKFKVSNFQRGSRDSKSLFTRQALKGGIVSPEELVDSYLNANRALFKVKKDFKLDLDAAGLLGLSEDKINSQTERVSKKERMAVTEGIFKPFVVSKDVKIAIEENATRLGVSNPYQEAETVIDAMKDILSLTPLSLGSFPEMENPFTASMVSALSKPLESLGFVNPEVFKQDPAAANNQIPYASLSTQNKIKAFES